MQSQQGIKRHHAQVRGGLTSLSLPQLHLNWGSKGCWVGSGSFDHIEPCQTSLNDSNAEPTRHQCTSSGRLDLTEPSPTAPRPGEQGVLGSCAIIRGGSTASNHVEPPRTTLIQTFRDILIEFGEVRPH